MKWSSDAEKAIKKVPFFVRKKVKNKVEEFVHEKGKNKVDLLDVDQLKKKFLSKGGMESQIKGYEVSTCFGGAGCPNSVVPCTQLAKDIEKLIEKEEILSFLKKNVKGDLKFHHEFRMTLSDCPNACSRPQIVDIGIIGAVKPGLSDEECTLCGQCVDACKENAVNLDEDHETPNIDYSKCLMCAKCIKACPTKTIVEDTKGYRVLLGGRLGRHPRLGMEVPGIQNYDSVLEIVKKSLKFYKKNSKNGQRFSHLLTSIDQIV